LQRNRVQLHAAGSLRVLIVEASVSKDEVGRRAKLDRSNTMGRELVRPAQRVFGASIFPCGHDDSLAPFIAPRIPEQCRPDRRHRKWETES
jgi:hypothetical protein